MRGNKEQNKTGVRLRFEDGQYVCYLAVQAKECQGGCWLRVPLAKNEKRDERHGEILEKMVSWEIPILQATVKMKKHKIILRFSYSRAILVLPMGERNAVLGPLFNDGRLLLRTELQTKSYGHKIAEILSKKDSWDLIRRRATAQIGWRKGHARKKRELLSRMSWDNWLTTFLHGWSKEVIDWLATQGVGSLTVLPISNLDWSAFRFVQMLTYKGKEAGIVVRAGDDKEVVSVPGVAMRIFPAN